MKTKRILTAILTICLMCSLFVGCQREDKSEYVRIIAHTEQEKVLTPFFEKFMEDNPDIKVDVLYGVGQDAQLETDLPPDLLFVSNLTAPLYEDIMLDLRPMLEADEEGKVLLDNFIDNTLEMMNVNEKLLALPLHTNVSLLYYNEVIFDKSAANLRTNLGLSATDSYYPQADWTWDDFATAGRTMTVKENNVYKQWGSTTVNTWWGEWLIYARQLGGDFFDENGNLSLKTNAFKRGMEFFKNKCYGSQAFAHNPTSTGVGQGSLGGFSGRTTAMDFGGHTGSWVGYNEIKNFKWNVAKLPTPEGKPDARGAEIAVEGYGIYKNALNKDKAFRVLKYLFSEAGQTSFSKLNKLIPTQSYKDLVLSVPYDQRPQPKNMEAVFEAMEIGMALPRVPGFDQAASTHIVTDVNKYISNEYKTVDEFVNNATINVQKYLNSLK